MTDDAAVLLLHEKEDAYGIEKGCSRYVRRCGFFCSCLAAQTARVRCDRSDLTDLAGRGR